jgi:hypothetical protein
VIRKAAAISRPCAAAVASVGTRSASVTLTERALQLASSLLTSDSMPSDSTRVMHIALQTQLDCVEERVSADDPHRRRRTARSGSLRRCL